MNDDKTAALVIEMAKEFMGLVRQIDPSWLKGYFRFSFGGAWHGSSASYVSSASVVLISTFGYGEFYDRMNEKGLKLLHILQKEKGVLLLAIDNNYDYKVEFDYEDLDRWTITKMNGGTGIPEGISL